MRLNKYQKKWLEALRSGKYRRAEGALYKNRGYCCLGVACVALKKDFNIKAKNGFYNEEETLLPEVLIEPLKIDINGSFIDSINVDGSNYTNLTSLNDSGRFSFKKIANIIEENYKSNNFQHYEFRI